ncbi:MAG TPA: DsrE family protein [Azospira sp.]|nr:DsrE family protein [Azospira sp.]
MQKILMIVHAPPYGSERVLSALRLATALVGQEDERVDLSVFMMSDAVTVGLSGQAVAEAGGGLQQMIENLVEHGVAVRLCRTCAVARGVTELPLIAGVAIGTLADMAAVAIEADKVITF